MRSHLRTAIALCALSALAMLVSGCMDTAGPAPGGGSSSSPISNPTPTPTLQGSNGFTFAGSDFFVNVQSPPGTTMLLHQDGNWTQPCKASIGQSAQDMTCILEAQELDLYFNGANLVWNGPQQQCSYVTVTPYYFYQFQPGTGPTNLTAHQVINNGIAGPVVVDGYSGGTTAAVVTGPNSQTLTCSADYTQLSPNPGPNCCQGNYIMNMTTTTITNSGATTTTGVTQSAWGGKATNCLSGPAVDTQKLDVNGYPQKSIYFLQGGTVNQTYQIQAPIQKALVSNAYAANYFCPGNSCPATGGATGTYSLANSVIPTQPQLGTAQTMAIGASVTSGSPAVFLGLNGGISVGSIVTDTLGAIPVGTTVLSFVPGESPYSNGNPIGSVTLSKNATLNRPLDTLNFYPAVTPNTASGTVTLGSSVVTNANVASGESGIGTTGLLSTGMGIWDTAGSIPLGSTITGFFLGNPSTINISSNATASTVGDNIYIGNVTGTVTVGSNQITNANIKGTIVPGMAVADVSGRVPAGTIVTSVTIGTPSTITMSQNATATVAADVIAINNGPSLISREGSPWYEFDCVDSAYGYNHRLRVMVRSWDQHSAFNLGSTGNPFIFGPQGPPFMDQPEANYSTWPLERASNGSVYPGFSFTSSFYPYPARAL